MVGKNKFVLGLLAGFLTVPPVLGDGKDTTPESLKKEPEGGIAVKDTDAPRPSANSPEEKGTGEIPQILGRPEGGDNSIEARPTTATGTRVTGELSDSEFEKKLIDVVNKNPQIIVGALQKFTENQEKELREKMEASFLKYKDEISKDSSGVLLGKKDADVKLVVFLDPNCPHCRPFTQALFKVRDDFPNVAILVRYWPILKDSEEVVRGLWAIKQQGQDQYNAICKAIAASPGEERYTYAKLLGWVKDHKLDVKKFEKDSQSKDTVDVVNETSTLAKNIGLQGTPTSLLVDKNSVRLVMPTDEKSLESIFKNASDPAKA